jgi:hypothetical protein
MRIEKYGWSYEFEDIEGQRKFKVVPSKKIEIPTTLWKLFSIQDNSVESFIENYIWASHPATFNDVFDCFEGLIEFNSEESIRRFFEPAIEKKEVDAMLNMNFDSLKVMVQNNFKEIIYRKWGVLSLTNNPGNIMMWSYYNAHYGFALEFDYSKFPFKNYGPFPLNYQDEIQPISIDEAGGQLAVLYQSNIKYKGWEHEDEWRIIIDAEKEVLKSSSFKFLRDLGGQDRKFYYPKESIKSIALGNRFFDPDEIEPGEYKTYQINIDEANINKFKIMEYISNHGLDVFLALRNKDFKSISFYKGIIEKKKEYLYRYIVTSN